MAAKVRLKFVRPNALPAGARFHVLTNGTLASNGDLVPPVSPSDALITQLTAQAIEIWPVGKAGLGAGPAGGDAAGFPGNWHQGYGAGCGPAGLGEAGLYADWIEYETPVLVRDGTYRFGVQLEAIDGTIQEDPVADVQIEVKGTPRAPLSVQFAGWNESNGTIGLSWTTSPDIA